ncbi:MAG: InlB B-repeat-containing protein [Bacilli bacterium]|nr:InlB B-repeat-containing protein [Bacilli bacterium]
MNISIKKIGTLVLFVIIILVLSGCDLFTSQETVTSIEVEATTLEDSYDIDTFELSSISIKVSFSDGKFQSIPITEAMLSNEHLALLSNLGEHQITITYKGKTTSVTLRLINNEVKEQLMAIYTLATTEGGFTGTYEEWLESIQGEAGEDGHSPIITIGTNGNWYIDGVDTLVQAQGIQGEVGNGISAIALTKTEGLVDTYTITYTDGTTSTFTLTNGEDGKSAYQTYIENNPLYTKTESEWLEDLVNGRLATIEETKYTVTFNSDGGTLIDSQKVIKGEKATEPTIPIKEGYTFVGWFMGEEKWSFIGYSVTEDITLVAKWIEDIDFNIEGATLESNVYHLSVDNNVTSINFKQIVQSNQIWYLSKDINGTSINITKVGLLEIGNNTFYIIEEDGNDYNTYEINIRRLPMYTVTFITNSDAILESIEIQEGSLIGTIPTITKEGYAFDKWDYDFTTPVTSNITLSASWILIEYDIIYHLDGGINSVNNPDKYSNISNTIILEDATKTGFTFLGWYSEETFISKVTKIEQGSTNDITLYARFAAETYTLHFVTNGGSEVSDITEEYGKEISVSTIRDGYNFVGWYKDSSLSLASYYELGSTMPAENLTLYAKWEMITYSIVYVMNEYTTNDASNPATYNVTSNISLISPSVIEGIFIGWFTDEDYTYEIENISNMTGNLTLYGKVEMNQYTMTFVTNGGTEISPITQDYDTAIHVSTTKEGYMFAAWCSDEGLTTSIDISKMPNANLTVYAKWAQMYEYFTIDNMTYVYYGTYPQTVVDDSSLISSLNSLTSTNANGYYEFEGEEYAKVVATPNSTGYQFINGATITSSQTYYFKVEPIKWRVLEEADGTYTLLSEYIIDKQVFYPSAYSTRTIDGKTIYANNYEHSTIRGWLNNEFYIKAFSNPEKSNILTTLVDNSASTTEIDSNPYVSNNTIDKVYLLSYQDVISSNYGFSTSFFSSSTRTAITTDYARAVGAYMNTSTSYYGNGWWWLRSASINGSISAYYVSDGGIIDSDNVSYTYYGARPAIKIN